MPKRRYTNLAQSASFIPTFAATKATKPSSLPYLNDDVVHEILLFLGCSITFEYDYDDECVPPSIETIEDSDLFGAAQLSKGFWIQAVRVREETIVKSVRQSEANKELRERVKLWCSDKEECERLHGDISGWDVSNISSMRYLFGVTDKEMEEAWGEGEVHWNEDFDEDLSRWNVANVTDLSFVFHMAKSFNGDLSSWNVSNVTTMEQMFREANAFNGDLSSWDASNVTTMEQMFYEASVFNGDLSLWDVSNVTTMEMMFYKASAFNCDLSSWNVKKVKCLDGMFHGATSFDKSTVKYWDLRGTNRTARYTEIPAISVLTLAAGVALAMGIIIHLPHA